MFNGALLRLMKMLLVLSFIFIQFITNSLIRFFGYSTIFSSDVKSIFTSEVLSMLKNIIL